MEYKHVIVISIFLLVIFAYSKIANGFFKKEVYGKKYLKSWSGKTFFWQGAVFISSGITFLIVLFLKSINII